MIAFITGLFLVVIAFALRLIESTRDLARNRLEYIFRLIPFFTFHFGVLNVANRKLFSLVYEYDKVKSPFSTDIALWDLIYLIFTGILFWIIIFLIEYSYKLSKKFKIMNLNKIKNEIATEDKNEPKEEDVIKEE